MASEIGKGVVQMHYWLGICLHIALYSSAVHCTIHSVPWNSEAFRSVLNIWLYLPITHTYRHAHTHIRHTPTHISTTTYTHTYTRTVWLYLPMTHTHMHANTHAIYAHPHPPTHAHPHPSTHPHTCTHRVLLLLFRKWQCSLGVLWNSRQ